MPETLLSVGVIILVIWGSLALYVIAEWVFESPSRDGEWLLIGLRRLLVLPIWLPLFFILKSKQNKLRSRVLADFTQDCIDQGVTNHIHIAQKWVMDRGEEYSSGDAVDRDLPRLRKVIKELLASKGNTSSRPYLPYPRKPKHDASRGPGPWQWALQAPPS